MAGTHLALHIPHSILALVAKSKKLSVANGNERNLNESAKKQNAIARSKTSSARNENAKNASLLLKLSVAKKTESVCRMRKLEGGRQFLFRLLRLVEAS